jgi:NADPH:quinone reductase-like Zn-dependent oxidoreductase
VESGQLRPVVDRVVPFENAREAQRILEQRGHFGKIVLEMRPTESSPTGGPES